MTASPSATNRVAVCFALPKRDRKPILMTALLAAVLAVAFISQAAIVAAFLVARDRAEQRHAAEREAERAERQILLNRIQAPDTAVAQTLAVAPSATALNPDNDTDYWQYVTEQQVA